MNKNVLFIGVAVVAFLFYNGTLKTEDFTKFLPKAGVSSNAEVFPSTPTDQKVASAVEPVRNIVKAQNVSAGDKLALSRLYREMAKLVGSGETVKTTADLVRANQLAGKMMGFSVRYPGLGDEGQNKGALSNAIVMVIGDDVKAMDSATRQSAVNVLNGLSWAVSN